MQISFNNYASNPILLLLVETNDNNILYHNSHAQLYCDLENQNGWN